MWDRTKLLPTMAVVGSLLTVLTAGTTSGAKAAEVFYYGTSNQGGSVLVPGFDSRLGTLQSVRIASSFTATITVTATAHGFEEGDYAVLRPGAVSYAEVGGLNQGFYADDYYEWNDAWLYCQQNGACASDEIKASVTAGGYFTDPDTLEIAEHEWELTFSGGWNPENFWGENYCYEGKCSQVDIEFAVSATQHYWDVGYYYEPAPAPVPLPAAGLLMLAGLPVIALTGRRRPRIRRAS